MGEIIINEKPLNAAENKRLNELESVVKENFLGFVAVGNALSEIKEKRLYRSEDNRTFDGYCRELWDMGKRRAYQMIDSSEVMKNLHNCGQNLCTIVHKNKNSQELLPINEAQARELAQLEPEEQRLVWLEILAHRADQRKGSKFPKITAITVKKAVLKYKGVKLQVRIDQSTREASDNRKDFASDEFVAAYSAFTEQLKEAQASDWRHTSRNRAFNDLSTLLDLVAQAGPKEIKNKGCSMDLANREKLEKGGFRIFRVLTADLVIEESVSGEWLVSTSHETPIQLSDAFKELMEDPKNLRA